MNLMFWKKKTAVRQETGGEPEEFAPHPKPREALDFVSSPNEEAAPEADSATTEPDGDNLEPTGTTVHAGGIARAKAWFGGLTGYFRKPPAFRAEAGRSADSEDASEEEPETFGEAPPAKPGMAMRVKLQVIALMRRIRKMPEPEGGEEAEGDEEGKPSQPAVPGKPGLLKRLKAGLAAFTREIKASETSPLTEDEGAGSHERGEEVAEGEISLEEAAAQPVRSRRWLVINGSITIMILLLADIALYNWPLFKEPQKRWGTRHDQTDIASTPRPSDLDSPDAPRPYLPPEERQAEIETLTQQNAALQARVKALEKTPPRQPSYAQPSSRYTESTTPPVSAGEMSVGSKDPKAAAMTLKEAIEAMNAGTGDREEKPAK